MIIRPRIFFLAVFFVFNFQGLRFIYAQSLEDGWKQPPVETKPWVYWFWLSGHISKEGITKDLEAMKRWGIGRAIIGDINRPDIQRGPIKDLSEDYFSLLEYAVREGGRIGVDISIFSCPGWSQTGGPWIKPEQSMRYLVSTERRVTGPSVFQEKLPLPEKYETKPLAPRDAVQDVAVLAFPAPRGDTDTLAKHAPKVTSKPAIENVGLLVDGKLETTASFGLPVDGKREATVEFDMSTPEPFTARSLTLFPPSRTVEPERYRGGCFDADCELLAENADGSFQSIAKFKYARVNNSESTGPMPRGPVCASFSPATAKRFRLVFKNIQPPKIKNFEQTVLAEIELSGAARLDSYVEQQLGKMCAMIQPPWDYYLWKRQPDPLEPEFSIDPSRIVDLTGKMASDGMLQWAVPPGEWVIVRTMIRPTGVQNRPASKDGTGLEADKMSPEVLAEHYKNYVGKLTSRFAKGDRKALKGFIIDSYETGSQNWTDDARQRFSESFKYDPVPWLPVLTGRLVGSADHSARFLWDLRRFVADRMAHAYRSFRDIGNRDGLQFWLEPYGHYGFPAEYLLLGSAADGLGGEFWVDPDWGSMEVRAAVSAGHIYGKQVISAEAFTGNPNNGFTQSPDSLKALGDLQQSLGINHFVLHLYIHQPYERAPGINAWFGTEFNRLNTWYDFGAPWIDYQRRNFYLLQQGHHAAEVAYFIGEDAPKMAGIREPPLPEGYLADDINADVIRNHLQVKDGRFVLPDGMSYSLLVLPPLETMRPEILAKIRDLVSAGGSVLGHPPSRSPSLQNYPAADQNVQKVAKEMWGNLEDKARQKIRFGRGMVLKDVSVQQALDSLRIQPNVTGLEKQGMLWSGKEGSIHPWTHRTSKEVEIFFISNQQTQTVTVTPSFRVSGKQPELWDAVTAERRLLPKFQTSNGRTAVPLEFAPRQSLFVLFRKAGQVQGNGLNFPPLKEVVTLKGAWNVTFDPHRGGPEGAVVFDELTDWLNRPEENIRSYSGRALYEKEFELPALPAGKRLYLDLGEVSSLAQVRLNGNDLGVVWTAPWRVEVTSVVRAGRNKLELTVVNTWINRLLADEKLPKEQRVSWTATQAIRAQKPQPAGLLGPVVINVEKEE